MVLRISYMLIGVIVTYVICAFVAAEGAFSQWSALWRFWCVMWMLFWGGIGFFHPEVTTILDAWAAEEDAKNKPRR